MGPVCVCCSSGIEATHVDAHRRPRAPTIQSGLASQGGFARATDGRISCGVAPARDERAGKGKQKAQWPKNASHHQPLGRASNQQTWSYPARQCSEPMMWPGGPPVAEGPACSSIRQRPIRFSCLATHHAFRGETRQTALNTTVIKNTHGLPSAFHSIVGLVQNNTAQPFRRDTCGRVTIMAAWEGSVRLGRIMLTRPVPSVQI